MKTMLNTVGDREIVTERHIAAPPARVFAAWTDPDLIPRWWGLDSTTTVVEEMDVRPGGLWRFAELNEDGTKTVFRGVYREATPDVRLAYTFEWDGMPGHVSVDTVTLEADGDGTRITGHTIFHTKEERDGMLEAGMQGGLEQSYGKLDELLAE